MNNKNHLGPRMLEPVPMTLVNDPIPPSLFRKIVSVEAPHDQFTCDRCHSLYSIPTQGHDGLCSNCATIVDQPHDQTAMASDLATLIAKLAACQAQKAELLNALIALIDDIEHIGSTGNRQTVNILPSLVNQARQAIANASKV